MSTVHINAEKGDFAPVVLMPGDPVRVKYIVEHYLHDYKLVNDTRGMLAFTGYTENGKRISVMASGMGIPSMGIYSYELYNFFDVELIIRIGTCGIYQENIDIGDIIIPMASSTPSTFANQYGIDGSFSANADFEALRLAFDDATKMNLKVHVGNILCHEQFYEDNESNWKNWAKLGVLGVEMESYALFTTAARANKKALCILTGTDHYIKKAELSSKDRVTLDNAIKLAVSVADKFNY